MITINEQNLPAGGTYEQASAVATELRSKGFEVQYGSAQPWTFASEEERATFQQAFDESVASVQNPQS